MPIWALKTPGRFKHDKYIESDWAVTVTTFYNPDKIFPGWLTYICDFPKTKASHILRILASSLSSNYHFVISGDLRVLQSCDICEKSLPHRLSSNFRLQFDVFGFLSPLILRSSELCNYEILQFNFVIFVVFLRVLAPFASACMLKFCCLSKIRKFRNFLICLQCWALVLEVYSIWRTSYLSIFRSSSSLHCIDQIYENWCMSLIRKTDWVKLFSANIYYNQEITWVWTSQ